MGFSDDGYLLPRSGKSIQDGDNHSYRYDSISRRSAKTSSSDDNKEKIKADAPKAGQMLRAVPACLVVACWNIMLSVPFGSMFFSDDIPLAKRTKEKLGMRMSMMALGVSQSVMGGWLSGFDALTVWELAEVAPFYQTFASLAASNCRDDPSKIYPTTVYLISLSTVAIGIGYFVCGYFHIGKLLSFFPSYVTLGLIAGIGVWALGVSMTVAASSHIFDESEGSTEWWDYAMTSQYALSLILALGIRPLRKIFPDFLFLDPLYFLSIPIVFHIVIRLLGIDFEDTVEAGYVFEAPSADAESGIDPPSAWEEAGELWTLFDFSKVQWEVAIQATPQIFAATILGIMISTPFIPPLATLNNMKDYSPDKEFVAHGVANIIGGLVVPGGVPAVACYSSTVLYCNSGGGGGFSNFLLSFTSFISFVYGPVVGGYLPRCMASSILIDIGVALIQEGVADESHKCDPVEYMSIWIIMSVMNIFDMTSGLIAGLFMALFTSTYSSSNDDPVRRVCDARTFPSSRHRKESEMTILEDPHTGRKKIVIFQLHGSLFFGNISKIQDRLFEFLETRVMKNGIIIFDFTLVSSIDSSACIFFDSIQSTLKNDHELAATVFVASPSKLELKKADSKNASLMPNRSSNFGPHNNTRASFANETNLLMAFSERNGEAEPRKRKKRRSTMTTQGAYSRAFMLQDVHIHGTCFDFLDKALQSCEDTLLSLAGGRAIVPPTMILPQVSDFSSIDNDDPERALVLQMLKEYCDTESLGVLKRIVDSMRRETFQKDTVLWNSGDHGHSAKLFLAGAVIAYVPEICEKDENRFQSAMETGSFLGLRSLVLDEHHLATAYCVEESDFYSLDREAYDKLVQESPEVARILDLSMARYLSHRLRHVSNRIYQARSVPV